MAKLIIARGLPASGKSTYARAWVAEDPVRRARVNRDDLRAMAHNSAFIVQTDSQPGTERAIQAARDAAITALLKRGMDVVSDDTNLVSRTVRDLRRLAVLAGAEFEIVDLTDVPLDECLRRNALREGVARVPEDRIRDMHARYIAGKPHPLPLGEEPADPTAVVPYEPKPDTPKAIMIDVDGTVALMAGRGPYDETRVHEDRPNEPVIAAVRGMARAGHRPVFCSGRTDACRQVTEAWIRRHVFAALPFELHMRAVGDTRKDSVVKLELFDRHIRDRLHVVAVFDDRRQVVDMWRSLGLTVFQVAEGQF